MNVEINLIPELAKVIAKSLDGEGYNVKIWEIYYNLKKDLPSNTTRAFEKVAAKDLDIDLKSNHYFNRNLNLKKR